MLRLESFWLVLLALAFGMWTMVCGRCVCCLIALKAVVFVVFECWRYVRMSTVTNVGVYRRIVLLRMGAHLFVVCAGV